MSNDLRFSRVTLGNILFRRPLIALATLIAIVLAALCFGNLSSTPQPCSQWDDIPFTPAQPTADKFLPSNGLGVSPKAIGHTPQFRDQNWQVMVNNFFLLVDGIHDTAKRDAIKQAIESGELSVDIVGTLDGFDAVAQFVVSPDGQMGQIVLGSLYMSRLINDYYIAHARMAIIHEFEHFLQWRRSTGGERALFDAHNAATDEECTWLWGHELEAWTTGCQYFLEEGVPFPEGNNHFCQVFGNDAAFKQRLYRDYSANSPTCTRVYAKLAGHPSGRLCTQ